MKSKNFVIARFSSQLKKYNIKKMTVTPEGNAVRLGAVHAEQVSQSNIVILRCVPVEQRIGTFSG